jgi:hypothetical protein
MVRYVVSASVSTAGDAAAAWQLWTDVDRFAAWDPHVQAASLDGPFDVDVHGWMRPSRGDRQRFTVTKVVAGGATSRWQSRTELRRGALVVDHSVEDTGEQWVRLTTRWAVHGPASARYRLHGRRRIQRELIETLRALAIEASVRGAVPVESIYEPVDD